MLGGYVGRILVVDLTNATISESRLSDEECRQLIGGYGFGVKALLERQPGGVDPLGPGNILGFVTGPLTGTGVPLAGRYMVVAKSPLTGAWGGANSGGTFGARFKSAGYDGVLFSGIAPKPVYLLVVDGVAELRDAGYLWGHDTNETEDMLRAELGLSSISVACIGIAGELRSLIAAIINDKGRAAARCGLGAVMGSKRLKAIVAAGKHKAPVADIKRLRDLSNEFLRALHEKPAPLTETLKMYGTPGLLAGAIKSGAAPIKNWQLSGEQGFPDYEKLHGKSVTRYQTRKFGCYACSIACGGIVSFSDGGPYSVAESHKPEYETIVGFGPLCLNTNFGIIVKANDICNRAGIDTISASATVAFAMECYDRGLITKKDTGGIDLTWGDPHAIVSVIELMARREGFGEVLADGSRSAATKIGKGSEQFAMQVRGQEVGFQHSLFSPSRATMYVADSAPGRHTAGAGAVRTESGGGLGPYHGLGPPNLDRYDYKTKGPAQVLATDYQASFEASGLCFMAMLFGTYKFADFMAAVTGTEANIEELLTVGERITTLKQCFNLREKVGPDSFHLPERLLGIPPLESGPLAGITIDIETLLAEYYKARRWDPQSGWPRRSKLVSLGLIDICEKAGMRWPSE